jgi:hypothetical protein
MGGQYMPQKSLKRTYKQIIQEHHVNGRYINYLYRRKGKGEVNPVLR